MVDPEPDAEVAVDAGEKAKEDTEEKEEQMQNSVTERHGAEMGDEAGGGIRCCCGRDECVFLKRNCSVLARVERDVQAAARMGKALLDRHEESMASAARDRFALSARIATLASDKADMAADNETLRAQLDKLHDAARDADVKITTLEATLRDAELEVRRLEAATRRAAGMERHIERLEEEQACLRGTLTLSQDEAREAARRWHRAERDLVAMQDQLEGMEREAAAERERHVEVLSRIERQRRAEREAETAAGRTAAMKGIADGNASSVVSHFVRDLLQDNANLQAGMAELRELLMNSNDEIQILREQLLYHQPPEDGEVSAASTLRAELERQEAPTPSKMQPSQELHVHHHHHYRLVASVKAEQKKPGTRRKSGRLGLSQAMFTPPHPQSVSPALRGTWEALGPVSPSPAPAAVSHLSQASVSTASTGNPRWSLFSEPQSEVWPSTPSSPPSNPRNSAHGLTLEATSAPISPSSTDDPSSPPPWRGTHQKRPSTLLGHSLPIVASPFGVKLTAPGQRRSSSAIPPHHPLATASTHEEEVTLGTSPIHTTALARVTTPPTTIRDDSTTISSSFSPLASPISQHFGAPHAPRLRRIASHESIMSLASNGMDLHTLKARPSQLTLRPLGLSAAGTNLTTEVAVARPTTISKDGKRGAVHLRHNLVGLGLPLPRVRESTVAQQQPRRQNSSSGALGRLVSWRPWGSATPPQTMVTSSPATTPKARAPAMPFSAKDATPTLMQTPTMTTTTLTTTTTTTTLLSPTPSQRSTGSGSAKVSQLPAAAAAAARDAARASGINQPGAIPGFHVYLAAHQRLRTPPSKVVPAAGEVAREALREVLE